MRMIEVENIEKTYRRGDGTPVTALKDISFSVNAGEFVTVRGASGSGKSSLLNIIGCLDTPTAGSYRLAGEDVSDYTDQERSNLRCRRIGFIFQSFNLLPRTTAVENVEVPALYGGGRVDRERALSLLDRVGLADRAAHFIAELSGGEQQRVAIARAYATRPRILFADEPTGNLDATTGRQIADLMFALRDQSGTTLVLVTHEAELLERGDRQILIESGRLVSNE